MNLEMDVFRVILGSTKRATVEEFIRGVIGNRDREALRCLGNVEHKFPPGVVGQA